MGVNRVSFCFEIWDPARFVEICPGKHREYGRARYLEAIAHCASLGRHARAAGEPWVTNGEIIAGLEPPEHSMQAIDWITSVGAIPTVCVFRPLIGTDYADRPPPRTEEIVPVFAHLYEACARRGLPIGLAPNVHVSLVMLPEEGLRLVDRPARFLRFELRRRAMKRVVAVKLAHAFRAADRRRNEACTREPARAG